MLGHPAQRPEIDSVGRCEQLPGDLLQPGAGLVKCLRGVAVQRDPQRRGRALVHHLTDQRVPEP